MGTNLFHMRFRMTKFPLLYNFMARRHPLRYTFYYRYGSERSSVFVALSCLVQQIKTENRADVFTTVRKLRSQRQGMVQHVVSHVTLLH